MSSGPLGRIITFYSYKGGTGRSMALANIAWILACAGRRVLVIDWDLEAPGLHRYFRPFLIDDEVIATDGLIDMVDRYTNEAIRPAEDPKNVDPEWYLPFTDFSDYTVSVNFPHFRAGGKIDFLPAGRQGDHYARTVSAFNWQNFYDRLGGGGFIEAVKQRARAEYDYVLVDSRTGVSDTAGICSVQMPDTLVVCFTYNNQSIKGAAAVARSAREMRARMNDEKLALHRAGRLAAGGESLFDNRRYRIFPVAMRVDDGESERLAIRQAFARRSFADLTDHIGPNQLGEYWKTVEVPYTVFYAYEEVLAPFKDDPKDPKSVLAALLNQTRFITDGDVIDFQLPIEPAEKQRYLDAFAETPLTAAARSALVESQRETPEQAAARVAEAALAEMSEADRDTARRVLLRLVRIGDDETGGYLPIRVPLNRFQRSDRPIIETLVTRHVVTATTETAAAASEDADARRFVEFSDSRLLASWRTLTDWLAADHDFLLWRQRLQTYLTDWERSGRDRGALLSGRLLSEADLCALQREPDLNETERAYIEASREANAAPSVRLPANAPATAQEMREWSAPSAGPTMWAPAPASRPLWGAIILIALVGAAGLVGLWNMNSASPPPDGPASPAAAIQLPRFIGMASKDAKTAADSIGLTLQMTDGRATALFIDGVVADQTPAENGYVAKGAVVRLTVSSVTAAAPTLVGMTLSEALRTVDEQRLKLGKTDSRYVPDARVLDRIVAQQPAPGTPVPAGSAIDVVVSRAAQFSDFRVGVYYLQGDTASATLAESLRALVRKNGSDAQALPRQAQFFTGAREARQYEIRYGSPAERLAGQQLQTLLNKAGGMPPFSLAGSRLKSQAFISVFLPPSVMLTVEGRPGEDVQVWYRGDRETGEAPIVFTGKLGPDGRANIPVPRTYLVLGRPTRRGGIPLPLDKETRSAITVALPPELKK